MALDYTDGNSGWAARIADLKEQMVDNMTYVGLPADDDDSFPTLIDNINGGGRRYRFWKGISIAYTPFAWSYNGLTGDEAAQAFKDVGGTISSIKKIEFTSSISKNDRSEAVYYYSVYSSDGKMVQQRFVKYSKILAAISSLNNVDGIDNIYTFNDIRLDNNPYGSIGTIFICDTKVAEAKVILCDLIIDWDSIMNNTDMVENISSILNSAMPGVCPFDSNSTEPFVSYVYNDGKVHITFFNAMFNNDVTQGELNLFHFAISTADAESTGVTDDNWLDFFMTVKSDTITYHIPSNASIDNMSFAPGLNAYSLIGFTAKEFTYDLSNVRIMTNNIFMTSSTSYMHTISCFEGAQWDMPIYENGIHYKYILKNNQTFNGQWYGKIDFICKSGSVDYVKEMTDIFYNCVGLRSKASNNSGRIYGVVSGYYRDSDDLCKKNSVGKIEIANAGNAYMPLLFWNGVSPYADEIYIHDCHFINGTTYYSSNATAFGWTDKLIIKNSTIGSDATSIVGTYSHDYTCGCIVNTAREAYLENITLKSWSYWWYGYSYSSIPKDFDNSIYKVGGFKVSFKNVKLLQTYDEYVADHAYTGDTYTQIRIMLTHDGDPEYISSLTFTDSMPTIDSGSLFAYMKKALSEENAILSQGIIPSGGYYSYYDTYKTTKYLNDDGTVHLEITKGLLHDCREINSLFCNWSHYYPTLPCRSEDVVNLFLDDNDSGYCPNMTTIYYSFLTPLMKNITGYTMDLSKLEFPNLKSANTYLWGGSTTGFGNYGAYDILTLPSIGYNTEKESGVNAKILSMPGQAVPQSTKKVYFTTSVHGKINVYGVNSLDAYSPVRTVVDVSAFVFCSPISTSSASSELSTTDTPSEPQLINRRRMFDRFNRRYTFSDDPKSLFLANIIERPDFVYNGTSLYTYSQANGEYYIDPNTSTLNGTITKTNAATPSTTYEYHNGLNSSTSDDTLSKDLYFPLEQDNSDSLLYDEIVLFLMRCVGDFDSDESAMPTTIEYMLNVQHSKNSDPEDFYAEFNGDTKLVELAPKIQRPLYAENPKTKMNDPSILLSTAQHDIYYNSGESGEGEDYSLIVIQQKVFYNVNTNGAEIIYVGG